MKPNMFIMADNVPMRLQAVISAELETLWKFYASKPQTDLDLLVKVTHSEAFIQNEGTETHPKMVFYPETLEIKFEADSNMFYSMRIADRRFIREGVTLDSEGINGESVCLRVINDLTSKRKYRIGAERFEQLMTKAVSRE